MRFSELYKLYTLLESPNSIVDSKTGNLVYYYENVQSWSGYLVHTNLQDSSDYTGYILHTDIAGVAGHQYLNWIIKDGGDPEDKYHKWFKRLKTNIPEDDMRTLWMSNPTVQFRLWIPQKVMSFWRPWNKHFIPGIENAMKGMFQKSEEYTYEFDGATANDKNKDYACCDYQGLLSGKMLPAFDERLSKQRESEWEEDKKLLAQIQMGIKPTLNNKPRSIFNQGEGD